jgi:hypothetical protein
VIIPHRNATLLRISGGGYSPSYRGAEAADPTKWEGKKGAFVSEKVQTTLADRTQTRLKRTYIVIPGDLRPKVELKPGDTITYEYEGSEFKRDVDSFEAHQMKGVPRTVRIYFTEKVKKSG